MKRSRLFIIALVVLISLVACSQASPVAEVLWDLSLWDEVQWQ